MSYSENGSLNKAILDTNAIYSGLHKPDGVCGRILVAGTGGALKLYSIDFAKEELTTNLERKMGFSTREIQVIVDALPLNWIPREIYLSHLERALDVANTGQDSPFVAASIATGFPLISGDRHMWTAEVRGAIRVYKPREFFDTLAV